MLGRPAVVGSGRERKTVGRVADFVVQHPEDTFPHIDAVVVKSRGRRQMAPIASVIEFNDEGRVVLREAPTADVPAEDEALYLVEDLFDKQIVDVDGRKVVRINDIEVARTGGALRLVAADIGIGGIVRRLGGGRIPSAIVATDPAHADRLGQRRAAARSQPDADPALGLREPVGAAAPLRPRRDHQRSLGARRGARRRGTRRRDGRRRPRTPRSGDAALDHRRPRPRACRRHHRGDGLGTTPPTSSAIFRRSRKRSCSARWTRRPPRISASSSNTTTRRRAVS